QRSQEDLRRRERSQTIAALDLVPGGDASLAEGTLRAFYLREQCGAVRFLALLDEGFDALVRMNQIGEGFANVAFKVSREFRQDAIGLLVEIDLPPHHSVSITWRVATGLRTAVAGWCNRSVTVTARSATS